MLAPRQSRGLADSILSYRDNARVADKILEKEKDKPVGQVFDAGFSAAEMLDAVAATYLGVSILSFVEPI